MRWDLRPTSVRHRRRGERQLLMAMLADAIRRHGRERGSARGRAAARWMCQHAAHRYSFESACEVAEVDPIRLRRRLGLRAHVPRRVSRLGFSRGASA